MDSFARLLGFGGDNQADVETPVAKEETSVTIGECQAILSKRLEAPENARYIGAFVSSGIYRGLQASRSQNEWEWKPLAGTVRWHPNNSPAHLVLVTGASGSGKSTLAKSIILQLTGSSGAGIVCIDPHAEYSGVIESIGGRSYSANAVSLSLFELVGGLSPSETVAETANILKNALSAMGDIQLYYFSKCALAAYERKGITADKSTWNKRPPNLADVAGEVSALLSSSKRPDSSVFSLKRRLDALALTGLFGAKTQLPLPVVVSQPTCFDLSGIRSSDAQAIFVEVFLRKLFSYCQRKQVKQEITVVVDEAQDLCRSTAETTSFVGKVFRGGRKYGIGVIVLAQGFEGLDTSIAGNASVVFTFFSREPKDAEYAAGLHAGSRFGTKTQAVLEGLHSLSSGECLYSATGSNALLKVAVDAPKEFASGIRKPFVRGSQHQLHVFQTLRELLPNERIVYNDWRALEGYELDITLPERKVAVEVDGAPFHCTPEQLERDALKDKLLSEKGWKVYRINDDGLTFKELEEEALKFARWLAGG